MSLFNTHWKAILKHYATLQPMLWFLLWGSWLSLRLLWNLGLSGWHWDISKGRGFPQHIRRHWQSKLPDLSCMRHRLNPHPLWHEKEWNERLMLLEKGEKESRYLQLTGDGGELEPHRVLPHFCFLSHETKCSHTPQIHYHRRTENWSTQICLQSTLGLTIIREMRVKIRWHCDVSIKMFRY